MGIFFDPKDLYGGNGEGTKIPNYPTAADLPEEANEADLAIVLDEDIIYIYDPVELWKSTSVAPGEVGLLKDEADGYYAAIDHSHKNYEDRLETLEEVAFGENEGATINDEVPSANTVYSSAKTEEKLDEKADKNHTHTDLEVRITDLENKPAPEGGGLSKEEADLLYSDKDHGHQDLEDRIADLEERPVSEGGGLSKDEADTLYADINHSHSEYSPADHGHEEYVERMNQIERMVEEIEIPEGPTDPVDLTEINERIDTKADINHTHENYENRMNEIEERIAQLPTDGSGEGGEPVDLTEVYERINEKADANHVHEEYQLKEEAIQIDDENASLSGVYSSDKVEQRIAEEKVDESLFEKRIEVLRREDELPDPMEYAEGIKVIQGNTVYERGTKLEGEGELTPIFIPLANEAEFETTPILKSVYSNNSTYAARVLVDNTGSIDLQKIGDHWTLEFNEVVIISELKMSGSTNFQLGGFNVEVSMDGENWKEVFAPSIKLTSGITTVDLQGDHATKFIRINRVSGSIYDRTLRFVSPYGPGGILVPSWNKVLTSKSTMEVETKTNIDTTQINTIFFVKDELRFYYVDDSRETQRLADDGITKEEADQIYARIDHLHNDYEERIADLEQNQGGGAGDGLTKEEADWLYASRNHNHSEFDDFENRISDLEQNGGSGDTGGGSAVATITDWPQDYPTNPNDGELVLIPGYGPNGRRLNYYENGEWNETSAKLTEVGTIFENLHNGWEDGSDWDKALYLTPYAHYIEGFVVMGGAIQGGAIGEVVFNMYEYLSPSQSESRFITASDNGTATVQIKENGDVIVLRSDGGKVWLDGIVFRKEGFIDI